MVSSRELAGAKYEEKTQLVARELVAATKEKNIFRQWQQQLQLDEKLMAWAMANPGLRVQLFRFIDTLPALRSKGEVIRHLQQYLTAEEVELPGELKALINFTSPESPAASLAAATIVKAVETLAYKYISGETLKDVIKVVERIRKEKMTFSIDLLGEAVITEKEADSYLQGYLDLISHLGTQATTWPTIPEVDLADGQPLPKVQVSVKLTAFYSQFDPLDFEGSKQRVCERLRPLLRHAHDFGVAVHFDMEQYAYKDVTTAILQDLLLEEEFRQRTDIGVTLQAYLRDSEQDLHRWLQWAKKRESPITVRLVKGAYWDQEVIKSLQNHWEIPVFTQKAETDVNYENLTAILLENHQYLNAAIASHNVRSQAKAIAIAETLGIPKGSFECQILYGMGEDLARAIVKRGHRVRVYAPYGKLLPGMAYLIRRLLENTANTSFLRQKAEGKPVEELIKPPTVSPQTLPLTILDKNEYGAAADTDFGREINTYRIREALTKVHNQLGKTYLPLINGEYVQTEDYIDSLNPSNGEEVVGRVGLVNLDQAEKAIASAKEAFKTWSKTDVTVRANILRRAADIMEARRHQLTAWICYEVGKVVREADAEVSEAIDFCRYYAWQMERLTQGYNYDVPGETNRYFYQPRGIAVIIPPWNFPLAIATGMTVAALVTGNCALLKPAAPSSVIGAKIAEILVEAGIPRGVFQFIPGRGSQVGEYLVKHPDVHIIAFTGSREVGCQIYAQAAIVQPKQKHLKRVIAEMGGKNAIIIDESADLDQAVTGVVQSAFGYSGQKCSACSRVIVLESIYNTFVERLLEAVKSLNVGDARLPSTKVGPVIDAKAQKKILEYIEIGKQEASLALQLPIPSKGYFVPPTVFTDVKPNATIAQEEIFGPVLGVIKAENFDEALQIANNTDYALTGGLYSRTPAHIERARLEFEVGNLYINRGITGAIVARQPFGGFKLSGIGSKAGGPDYLLQFVEPKVVTENVQRHGFAPIQGIDN
ncbi:MAG: L-glutamate gamma-semialdehyde dehydrogenase [Geminocystis sp.]|nr:L-glutamate gamma-semialdehyde dehydrogenase [Geminocystis sp.]MCS7146945.1 L-glutamate gamma-semialdehyde dehydrogenase [Geminocystis sp.]MCX8077257.1 L-glutamate gamma-semialdehyde dehydrogenase [Geminocystis sp.]MDW8115769.1 L-glutamate gamma-semialdehyde dehydrogenase [Geminocystis sp.]MDW8463313.1 L-glutamate gamma-semialdehyde dehydrogenase [Geminocystis sp.]